MVKDFFQEKPKQWHEVFWYGILEVIYSVWSHRLQLLIDGTLLIAAVMIIYMFYILIRKQTESADKNNSTASVSAPTAFKNTMNINVWLNNMNEHIDSKKIISDTKKQEIIMSHLDKTTKEIMQRKIDDKKINNFEDFQACLKSYFGNSNASQAINLLNFITRKQLPTESLSTYHEVMKELAMIAYATTPKEIVEQYANDYFIKGLYDEKLKTQLALTTSTRDTKCLLAEAIEVQRKLVSIAETNNDVSTIIQHINSNGSNHNNTTTQFYRSNDTNNRYNTNHQQTTSNNYPNNQRNSYTSNQGYSNRNRDNNNQGMTHRSAQFHYQSPPNSPSFTQAPQSQPRNTNCYQCGQQGHIARDCTSNNRQNNTTSNDSQPTRNNSPSTQPATLATVRTQN